MKKSLIMLPLAAVLLTLTGCKKDNEKSVTPGDTVTLTATLGGGEKTEINGFDMKWSDGDKVTINTKEYEAIFPLEDYTTANFENVTADEDGKYEAYYPASLYDDGKYVLPATQKYDGNKLSSVSPMYAVTDTKVLHFHNICALAKLQVTGTGTVRKIVVTSDDNLCGEFNVVGNNGKYHAVISGSGSKTLTLNCGVGVGLSSEPTTFYIALPDGNLKNLTFKIGENESTPVDANLTAGNLYTKSMSDVIVSTPGALDGEFTINEAGDKVNFSQGNLQCVRNGSEWDNKCTWRFAENQWDYVATDGSVSTDYADKNVIDLFGWGTSGYDQTSTDDTYVHYQPWSTDKSATDHDAMNNKYGYGPAINANPNFLTGKSDWGYNAISNGGNRENAGWRTLATSEWSHLFNDRTISSGVRYAKATVNGVTGVILVPDNWSTSTYTLRSTNIKDADFTINNITEQTWKNTLEPAGCVFLPAAGTRSGTSVSKVGTYGYYWSSSPNSTNNSIPAHRLFFSNDNLNPENNVGRYYGLSVRLVLPVEN